MSAGDDTDLGSQIEAWRAFMRAHPDVGSEGMPALEGRLQAQVTDLRRSGLTSDEAFLLAVRRMAEADGPSREFAKEHASRLWRDLVLPTTAAADAPASRRSLGVALLAACGAAAAIKAVPALLGVGTTEDDASFYLRNLSLFVLPFLAAYFVWHRRPSNRVVVAVAAVFAVGAVAINAYPFEALGSTEVLAALHLPVVLWLTVGVCFAAGDWRSHNARMDFIRFTGEWVIYYALIALGGGVLAGFTLGAFAAIDVDASGFVQWWLLPCGAMGAVVVTAWLVESRQGIAGLAPVLTRVFTPLFTTLLLAFLVAVLATRTGLEIERHLLVFFDLLLILVLGLLLYALSSRPPIAPGIIFDRVLLLMVVSALAIDLLVLAAMVARLADFGVTANRIAALGLNLVLLVNLARAAWLQIDFLRHRRPLLALERWQTSYLTVFAAWAAVVVVVFPPVFGFA